MKFNRRLFLQSASLSLASLGGLFTRAPRRQYQKVLAQSTPRKLAFLVGINEYAQGNKLKGCITDVELQKELLTYRFGFQNQDILTLTNQEASRENILIGFEEHLLKQAQENDVVIFHFSGYGREVQLSLENQEKHPSLITYDSDFLGKKDNQDILLNNLLNLCESLKTKNYTIILDTSYQSFEIVTSTQLWLRSYVHFQTPIINQSELELKQKLVVNNNKNLLKNNNQVQGIIFTSATDGLATEITSNNFNAGLFSYSLTRSLWQSFPPINNLIISKKIASDIALINGELKYTNVTLSIENKLNPYYLNYDLESKGDAIVKKIIPTSNLIELELLGLPLLVFFNYGNNSCFSTSLNLDSNVVIQINSITGNKAKATVLKGQEMIKTGLILRELIRVIPRATDLMVALDSSLQRIEKVDATSALTSIGDIKAVNLGENYADCILGKLTSNDSYGLFSQAGVLLPNTMAKTPNEAVSSAVKRLGRALENRLAQKLVNLTLNGNSSPLPVRVAVKYSQQQQNYISYQETFTNIKKAMNEYGSTTNIAEQKQLINISSGSNFIMTIENNNDYDLYYLVIGFNTMGNTIAFISTKYVMVNPQETFTIPSQNSALKLIDSGTQGIGELVIICSKSPFNNTFNQVYKNSNTNLDDETVITLNNPVEIAKSILQDLHEGSALRPDLINNLSDVYAFDLTNWASFNFVYEIS
ncbi:MAG: caspase family protein [Cyanobacterium sp. T60_A2020_053]|nr:caspase family protein [Cyanobacterium sp. T60_A2020_053]